MPDNTQDPEVAKAQQATALFINRFHVTVAPDVVRIAFGEAVVGVDATYRVAVVMRTNDAAALSQILADAVTRINQANIEESADTSQGTGEVSDAG